MEIWSSVQSVVAEVLSSPDIQVSEVAAIGITNQRETAVVWDKNTGRPVYNAIVWQSRQTMDICNELKAKGLNDEFRNKTRSSDRCLFLRYQGQVVLDNVEGAREKAEKGDLLFGYD